MKKMSVKTSILLPALAVLIAGITIMIIIAGSVSSSTVDDLTGKLITTTVAEYSNKFETLCLDSYSTSAGLGPVLLTISESVENPRDEVMTILTNSLMANPNMLGIWTCWEPEAFDGKDKEYAGTQYSDDTGRFIPYVYRDGNSYGIEALVDYDAEGSGDYYTGARNSGKPYITDPFEYTVGDKVTSLYSIAIPILKDGKVAGVVGADIMLDNVASVMNSASILDDGYLFTLSPGGLISTHRNSELILNSYDTTWLKDYAADIKSIQTNGGTFHFDGYSNLLNENVSLFMSGVKIGDTGRYWVVCGLVTQKAITASSHMLILILVLMGTVMLVVVALTIFFIVRGQLKSLPVMTATAGAMAQGKIDFAGLESGTEATKNEITLLGRAFVLMAESVKAQAEAMARIAEGDYSHAVPVRSDGDVMNKAINDMIDRTTEIISRIHISTKQVSVGAKQLADGSQIMAQGSAEQSATVDQLSSSVSEIARKTKVNADMADKAAKLAETIKHNAEKGSRQMDEMTHAVKEINAASQSINKVIKVIDDIAFQTNILALNAAVEAARAGQHGKGFAVVAEEVRNLAAKSAEAAKDTGSLIANSMEKAGLGARIADETAASLAEIVSGINESDRLTDEIAKSSGEQSAGIAQINNGIDQVAQVVQQNSATAEESAAASEEMSSQAIVLEELIAQFKLKDGIINNKNLPNTVKMPVQRPDASAQSGFTYNVGGGDYGKY